MATGPLRRTREIALATIVISSVILLTSGSLVTGPQPKFGELLQFSYAVNRIFFFPVSVFGVLSGVALLCRCNWGRWGLMAICVMTCLLAAFFFGTFLLMLGEGKGDLSIWEFLLVAGISLLMVSVPGIVAFRWFRFLHGAEARSLCTRQSVPASPGQQ